MRHASAFISLLLKKKARGNSQKSGTVNPCLSARPCHFRIFREMPRRGTGSPCLMARPCHVKIRKNARDLLLLLLLLPPSSLFFHSTPSSFSLYCGSFSLSIPTQSSPFTSQTHSISCQNLQPFHPHSLYPTNSSPFHLTLLKTYLTFSL